MKQNGRSLLISLFVLVLLVGAFLGGGVSGWVLRGYSQGVQPANPGQAGAPTPTPVTGLAQQDTPEKLQERFKVFWQVWDLVEQNFYDPSRVDYQRMAYGAIKGMVQSLGDDYTMFSTPAETDIRRTELQSNYEGIGAYIGMKDGYAVIQGPVNDQAPAAKAGLRNGDIVLEVDGTSVEGMAQEDIIALIKGPAGSEVTIKLFRPDEQRDFTVTITRARIEVSSVEGRMREDGVAYLKISVFGDTTATEMDTALQDLLKQNPSGIIVDLRGNGGGYLRAAQEILGRFLREGVATYERDRDGKLSPLPVINGEVQVFDLPMVVLVDGGSASASEITAGALQDHKRGTLVGEQTFGKGSIQSVIELPDGASVRITIAHWLTPNQREIQDVGLTPDLIVTRTPEDYDAGRDPQLDTAAAYLLGKTLPAAAATPTPKP